MRSAVIRPEKWAGMMRSATIRLVCGSKAAHMYERYVSRIRMTPWTSYSAHKSEVNGFTLRVREKSRQTRGHKLEI